MSDLKDTLQESADNADKAVRQGLNKAKQAASDGIAEVQSHLSEHPCKMMGIALLAGIALGLLMRSRRH